MQRTALAGLVATTLVLAAGWVLLGGPTTGGSAADVGRPIVLVSGRDDHGLVELEEVALLAAPALEGDEVVVTTVPDGTLVRVLGDDGGSWLEVVPLDGGLAGWIDDHRLRGTAHVVGEDAACATPLHAEAAGPVLAELRASEQVELLDDHTTPDGDRWVGVRVLQGGALGLVPADRLSQQPGPPPVPGVDCATIEPDPEAVPHQH